MTNNSRLRAGRLKDTILDSDLVDESLDIVQMVALLSRNLPIHKHNARLAFPMENGPTDTHLR